MKDRTIKYRMRNGLLTCFMVLAMFVSTSFAQSTGDSAEVELEWTTEKLANGIYWKSYQGRDLYDSWQSINLIEVVLDSADTDFHIAFHQDSLIKISSFAEKHDAFAAINGSFFDTEEGGSLVFLKVEGEIISEGVPHRDLHTENGGVGWSENQPIQILDRPENGWKTASLQTILSSGPLLLYNSQKQPFTNDPFHQNRHPRSAVALSNDNRLYLVTVDGRSFQSYGMTIPELTNFLQSIGAVSALNLDGGGSTTMWIRNKNENGIVNYPSDNLEFDHNGERRVSNALLILVNE